GEAFANKFFYEDLGSDYDVSYSKINTRISDLDSKFCTEGNYMFYLATPPNLYEIIAKNLAEQGLSDESNGFRRLIVEKPFGYNLETAKNLNKSLHQYFN